MFLNKYLISLFMVVNFAPTSPVSIQDKNFTIKPYLHKICCYLLGHKDAPENIQQQFNQATKAFGINPMTLVVKQINNCPVLKQFSSFTWTSTWINNDEWEKMSSDEKTWESFHEVAHTALSHPLKQIGVTCAALVTSIIATRNPLILPLIAGTLLYISVPWYARRCEKQADIAAATKLHSLGKTTIVQQLIDSLKNQKDESSSIWFNSSAETARYLENTLTSINKN